MTKYKVCLLGTFGVGKTSLVRRFIHREFSDVYQSTVGVRIDKKQIAVEGKEVLLLVWDLAGEDEFQHLEKRYLRGSSGFLYVADGTRDETFRGALTIAERAEAEFPGVPSILLGNKADLEAEWEIDLAAAPEHLRARKTSALSGENVEEAFEELAGMMLQSRGEFL